MKRRDISANRQLDSILDHIAVLDAALATVLKEEYAKEVVPRLDALFTLVLGKKRAGEREM